jgi:hypothetical protein
MQLFIPSILVALVGIIIVVIVLPNFSPLIIVIVSTILLLAGTYHHYTLFQHEYKQSTWQDGLIRFAPGIMILSIMLFLFISITGLFSSGSVPVPSMPAMELPPAETATNAVTAALNSTMSAVNSAANSVSTTVSNAANSVSNSLGNAANSVAKSVGLNAKNNSGPTRSFFATV